jgi:hypothetical protein
MRLKLALLTTVLAFGLGAPAALAEDAPGAKSDIIIAGAPADEAAPAAQDEQKQGAPEEGGAVARTLVIAAPLSCRRLPASSSAL